VYGKLVLQNWFSILIGKILVFPISLIERHCLVWESDWVVEILWVAEDRTVRIF
jgi:hypothetical protein